MELAALLGVGCRADPGHRGLDHHGLGCRWTTLGHTVPRPGNAELVSRSVLGGIGDPGQPCPGGVCGPWMSPATHPLGQDVSLDLVRPSPEPEARDAQDELVPGKGAQGPRCGTPPTAGV